MMPTGPTHPRMRGVGHAPTPAEGSGAPRTVSHIAPLEQYALQYYDENGTLRVNILIKVGDQFYLPPNGIEWAAALKPAAEWVRKGVISKIRELSPGQPEDALPQEDAVNVLGGDDGDPPSE